MDELIPTRTLLSNLVMMQKRHLVRWRANKSLSVTENTWSGRTGALGSMTKHEHAIVAAKSADVCLAVSAKQTSDGNIKMHHGHVGGWSGNS